MNYSRQKVWQSTVNVRCMCCYCAGEGSFFLFFFLMYPSPEEGSVQVVLRSKLSQIVRVINLLLTVCDVLCSDKISLAATSSLPLDSASFNSHIISGVYLLCISKQEGIITLTTTPKHKERAFSLCKNRRSQLQKDTGAPTVSVTPHQCNEHENVVCFAYFFLYFSSFKRGLRAARWHFTELVAQIIFPSKSAQNFKLIHCHTETLEYL